jgi:hypothetical protein
MRYKARRQFLPAMKVVLEFGSGTVSTSAAKDWNVADRRRVRAFQTEIIYKRSRVRENVLDQIRAMDAMRRGQIHRLVELRKHACEVDGVVQPVAISVEAIQTMRSRERDQEGEKAVEVLSFDVILAAVFPADGVPKALEPLADGVSLKYACPSLTTKGI